MTAEYKTETGYAPGYFCMNCGKTVNMLATGHGEGKCEPNPELVDKLKELNK